MTKAKPKAITAPVAPDLRAAILADPTDDDARRVYADALQDAGDPRGEFIAVQLELATAKKRTPKTTALWARFRALHSAHAAKWAKPLRALGKRARWDFHRGFARQLRLEFDEPKSELFAALLAVEPVTHLVIDRIGVDWIKKALATPGIERLRRLTILSVDVSRATELARTVATAKLGALEELRIGLLDDAAVTELAKKSKLSTVTHLALGCGGHGVELHGKALAKLAASALGKQLHTLELGRCAIDTAVRETVIAMTNLTRFSPSVGEVLPDTGDPDDDDDPDAMAALRRRFGKGLVIEDEPSFDYLLDGVEGLTKQTLERTGKK